MSLYCFCFYFLLPFISELNAHQTVTHPRILFISISGLNQEVLHQYESSLPILHDWFHAGSAVRKVKAVFPAQTGPTLWTLMTGVYPQEHGVVLDTFPPKKNSSEPIWATNLNEGNNRISTILKDFPGVSGPLVKPLNPNQSSVETVISWFADELNPINLALLRYGTLKDAQNDEEIKQKLGKFDAFLKELEDKLAEAHLTMMNVVVFGDSGMSTVSTELSKSLTEFQQNNNVHLYDTAIAVNKPLDPQQVDSLSKQLTGLSNISVFKDGSKIPDEWHWASTLLDFELIALSKPGVAFTNVHYASWFGDESSSDGFFVARGPGFQSKKMVDEAQVVDLYPLLCQVLELKPRPNQGSLDRVRVLIAEKHTVGFHSFVVGLSMLFVLVPCLFISIRAFKNCDKDIDTRHLRPGRLLPAENGRKSFVPHGPLVSSDDDDDDSL